jgi:hypothetical protein
MQQIERKWGRVAERIYDGYSTHTLLTGRICVDIHHILTSPFYNEGTHTHI